MQGAGASVNVMLLHWDVETHPVGPRISAELHRQRGRVVAMADEAKQKAEAKGNKEKKAKAPAEAAAAAGPKVSPPPRPPSDPRLKLLEQFRGRFLPKGVLRDRYKALMQRWDSADDHGGVTVEELRALFEDRKSAREKSRRLRKA